MATQDVVRNVARCSWASATCVVPLALAFVGIGCSSAKSTPPQTAVSQQEVTSAEVANVQVKLPPGSADRMAPPVTATTLQLQMVDDLKYPTPSTETAREWGARYPFPAKMLGEWTEDHPESVQRLLRWESEQPDHVRSLVRWAIANPYDGLGSFMIARRGWDDLRAFRDADPEAIDSLMAWCRAAPRAADELVVHSEGLGGAIAVSVPRR